MLNLRLLASQVDTVRSDVHPVVELVAWVRVELEVRAHGCLNRAVKSSLDLLSDFLVIVTGAELLVKLVVCRGIKSIYIRRSHCS